MDREPELTDDEINSLYDLIENAKPEGRAVITVEALRLLLDEVVQHRKGGL